MSRALLLLALLATGCRLETPETETAAPPEAQTDGSQTDRSQTARASGGALRESTEAPASGERTTPDPPVAAGDTMRVTQRRAGTATPNTRPLGPEVSARGWAVPVLGIAPEDLVDTFTAARSEGRTHNAIDILAPRGTPVVAASGGTVQRLFTSDKGGLTVYVLGQDKRTVSYYAHLDAYAPGLKKGKRVARGAPIGTVGDSGNAAPGNTHLHFAVWTVAPGASFWDGEPVNPYGLLAR